MTRIEYLSKFDSLSDAVDFEETVLSISPEFLPTFAQAVLADSKSEPAPEYWAWLTDQLEAVDSFGQSISLLPG